MLGKPRLLILVGNTSSLREFGSQWKMGRFVGGAVRDMVGYIPGKIGPGSRPVCILVTDVIFIHIAKKLQLREGRFLVEWIRQCFLMLIMSTSQEFRSGSII